MFEHSRSRIQDKIYKNMSLFIQKPNSGEYARYYGDYISLVKHSDPLWQLEQNLKKAMHWMHILPADKWDYSYEQGKWSFKEVMIHIIDTERILATRALCIARGEEQALPGFDQNHYMMNADAADRTVLSIVEEYQTNRQSTISLFRHLTDNSLVRLGLASNQEVSPRAISFIIAGHEMHHFQVIHERYFPTMNQIANAM